MGYTHYWTQPKDYSTDEWFALCVGFRAILTTVENAYGAELCREYDKPRTRPKINKTCLHFNGRGEDGHETFRLEPKRDRRYANDPSMFGWSFCKTAQKPYDLAVVAILTYLAAMGWRVTSDGDASEWQAGVEAARDALPHLELGVPEPVANNE